MRNPTLDRDELLERFFYEVAQLTLNHDTVGDYAVVFPKKLGEALEKVDPGWYAVKPPVCYL